MRRVRFERVGSTCLQFRLCCTELPARLSQSSGEPVAAFPGLGSHGFRVPGMVPESLLQWDQQSSVVCSYMRLDAGRDSCAPRAQLDFNRPMADSDDALVTDAGRDSCAPRAQLDSSRPMADSDDAPVTFNTTLGNLRHNVQALSTALEELRLAYDAS
jgi:hypothetical protein